MAQQPQKQSQAAHGAERSQQTIFEARAKRYSAEASEIAAKQGKEKALLQEQEKLEAFAQAGEKEKEAQDVFETARNAFEAAKLAFEAAKTCLADATTQVQFTFAILRQASQDVEEAQKKENEARHVAELARQTERKLQEPSNGPMGDDTSSHENRPGAEHVREEELIDPRTEANRRKAELEESRRKMEELPKQEEADRLARQTKAHENELQESVRKMAEFEAEERRRKQEKAEAEVRAREAAKRAREEREREREEAERKAREQRETEERERKERQERYNPAAEAAVNIVRQGLNALWPSRRSSK
ncbi:hypothetical protein EIP86_009470 [Pleurotus ostreatoroseus]|nr:hypothetical protein EIP86_009470 [Pleurotus ostreatoroseus]